MAGFVGPMIYSSVSQVTGSPRVGFGVLILLACAGLFVLMQVDLEHAAAAAHSDAIGEGGGDWRGEHIEPTVDPDDSTSETPKEYV